MIKFFKKKNKEKKKWHVSDLWSKWYIFYIKSNSIIMRFLFPLQCEKLITLRLCRKRNFQIFWTKLMFLNQTMHSLKYSFNMKLKKPQLFHFFSSNQWSLQAWPFPQPIPNLREGWFMFSNNSAHKTHARYDDHGHSGFHTSKSIPLWEHSI